MPFLVRVLFLSTVFFPTFSFAHDATTDSIASPTAIEKVLPDSSNFVTASILLSSPGKEAFFALGHSGIRLNCPSKGLDYCFSFSTILQPGPAFNLALILGQMKGGYEALPYNEYIKTFADEGRGVMEYALNLTLHEEQELWRLMDQKIMKGPVDKFDFLNNNCTSTLFKSISSILENESFSYPNISPLNLNTRDAFHVVFKDTPWMEFMGLMMLSAISPDKDVPLELIISPKLWAEILPKTIIKGLDGSSRQALEESPKVILPQILRIEKTPLTPTLVFSLLFLLVMIISILEYKAVLRTLPRICDILLFTAYTLFALYLLYASCMQIFGMGWNWFLIVFNPLPPLLWLLFRKKHSYSKIWIIYSAILLCFMVFYSLHTGRMEWAHEFMLAILLARCLTKYLIRNKT